MIGGKAPAKGLPQPKHCFLKETSSMLGKRHAKGSLSDPCPARGTERGPPCRYCRLTHLDGTARGSSRIQKKSATMYRMKACRAWQWRQAEE